LLDSASADGNIFSIVDKDAAQIVPIKISQTIRGIRAIVSLRRG